MNEMNRKVQTTTTTTMMMMMMTTTTTTRMLEDYPLEISQRLICLVGSRGTQVVMQEQHAFGEESWSLPYEVS
jgi:hypothetical protein